MDHQTINLGPFSGGLNKFERPALLQDNQLTVCQNLDIGRGGELTTRVGLKLCRDALPPGNNTVSAGGINAQYLIGTSLLANNTTRAFAYNNGDGNIYYADGATITTFNSVWSPLSSLAGQAGVVSKSVQYNGKTFLIPRDLQFAFGTNAVGVAQDIVTNVCTSVPNMPRGSGAVIFKDRLFIFGPVDNNYGATQRVYYSASTDFTSWPGANFFDINPGDGEGITAAYVIQDAIVFFKRHSTYILTFDSDPGLGTLRKINSAVGCTGADAVVQYENALYVIEEQTIYRFSNYTFTDIGRNLNLPTGRTTVQFGSATQDFAFVTNSKILFVIYTGTGGLPYSYYVLHMLSNSFSEYLYSEQPARFFRVLNNTNFEDVIASRVTPLGPRLYKCSPFSSAAANYGDYPTTTTVVKMQTKDYNFGDSSDFKRMFWWGGAIASTANVKLMTMGDNQAPVAPTTLTGILDPSNVSFLKIKANRRARVFSFYIEGVNNLNSQFIRINALTVLLAAKARVGKDVTA